MFRRNQARKQLRASDAQSDAISRHQMPSAHVESLAVHDEARVGRKVCMRRAILHS